MATQKKIDTVTSMTQKVKKAHSLYFADYIGIKHKQLEELRRGLRKVDGEFMVTKNKLMLRAFADKQEEIKPILTNATATIFAYGDEIAPLKELLKFFKNVNLGKTKGGLLGNVFLSEKDVDRLAKLPGKQELLAKLVGQLNAPIQGFHYALSWNLNKLVWALNAVKDKKSQ